MKILFASDIHGSASAMEKILRKYEEEKAERFVLLGDLLYHGPRNDLPDQYAPKEVFGMLNSYPVTPLCVRGNCDAEVDQMVLQFPIMADYCVLEAAGRLIYATHGHTLSEQNPPRLQPGDVLLHGHTHVPACTDHGSFLYLNPGSVSIPKADSWHGYMTLEDGTCVWKDMEGSIKMQCDLQKCKR